MRLPYTASLLAALFSFSAFGMENRPDSESLVSPLIGKHTLSAEPIQIQIGDAEYAIPANYFSDLPNQNCNTRSVLLEVLFPAIEARTQENRKFFNALSKERQSGRILLNYGKHTNPDYPFEGALGRIFRRKLENLKDYNQKLHQHGLIYFASINYEEAWYNKDLFSDGIENPKRFIECSLPNKVPSPGCSIYFYHKTLLTKSTFARKFLSDWEIIENNIRKKLDSFHIGSISKEKPHCKDTFEDVVISPLIN